MKIMIFWYNIEVINNFKRPCYVIVGKNNETHKKKCVQFDFLWNKFTFICCCKQIKIIILTFL